MAHAERCPVCHGSGKLPDNGRSTAITKETCHGCLGRGWVTVEDAVSYPRVAPIIIREPARQPATWWTDPWGQPGSSYMTTRCDNQTPQTPVRGGTYA